MKKRGATKTCIALVTGAMLAGGLSSCASAPPNDDPAAVADYRQANDPMEPFNRGVFAVNVALDKVILKPVAFVYKEALPDPFQDWIRNFLHNLRTPVILANDILQGEFGRAGNTFTRFLMNSGLGLFGALDIATEFGIPKHDEDFGQTMASWGSGEGAYLMLPILGPSNPRDALGKLIDFAFDPFTYLSFRNFSYARAGAEIVDFRAQRYDAINELERTSLDYYAAVRSLYRQTRNDEIRNGRPAPLQPLPTISFNWGQTYGIQESHNLPPLE